MNVYVVYSHFCDLSLRNGHGDFVRVIAQRTKYFTVLLFVEKEVIGRFQQASGRLAIGLNDVGF